MVPPDGCDDRPWRPDGVPTGGVGRLLISEEELRARVEALGRAISDDYAGRPPLLVGVLKGAFMFMSDLARSITMPVEFDFMAVSSYGHSTESSGIVRIVKDLDTDVRGRDVLVVEDIVDSGLTLRYLLELLDARQPASLEVCALLAREGARIDRVRYVGFDIPADFVVGYGLDVAECYRELPGIHVYDVDAE